MDKIFSWLESSRPGEEEYVLVLVWKYEVVNYCSFTGITGKNIFLLGPAWSVTKIRPGKSWFCFFGKVQDPAEANSVMYNENIGVDIDHEGGDSIYYH